MARVPADENGMESTGVDASIPETKSVDASSFVQASRKHPERCLRQGTHLLNCGLSKAGEKRFLVFWLLSFCVGSADRVRRVGSCLALSSGLCFLFVSRTGRRPKNRSFAGIPSMLQQWYGPCGSTCWWVRILSYHPLSFSLCLFPCSPEAFNSVEPTPSVEVPPRKYTGILVAFPKACTCNLRRY